MLNKLVSAFSILILLQSYCLADNGDPDKGETLSGSCVACHGPGGNSINPIWPKLAGQHSSYIVKQLQDFKAGNRENAQMSGMAASLSDQDMYDLAAFFSKQTVEPGLANPDLIKAGETMYRAGDSTNGIPACMACHGPAGKGNPGALYPSLAGQHAPYIVTQLKAFKAEDRKNDVNSVMRTIAAQMSNEQIDAVAEYIQGLR